MKLIDLTGKRFERLTAVRVSGHKPVKWECVCDCGNVVNVSAGNLTKKTNSTRSCGCLWASDIKIEVGQVRESNSGKFEVVELLGGEKFFVNSKTEILLLHKKETSELETYGIRIIRPFMGWDLLE